MGKKLLSMVLALALMFSLNVPAFAAEISDEPKPTYDLENYMVLTDEGLISFDTEMASKAGFSDDVISRYLERIEFMNNLVINGVTTISEDFTARVYVNNTRSANESTYVEYSTWGYTIYYSVADTQKIVNSLPNSRYVTLASIVGLVSFPVGVVTTGISVWSENIRAAAANGTGIWIQVYDDGTTATPLCSVGAR